MHKLGKFALLVSVLFVAATTADADWMDGEHTGYDHEAPAGVNRVLIVFCHAAATAAPTDYTAVTYGGQPLTQVVERLQNQANSFSAVAEIWFLDEAGIQSASGSTIVATTSGTSHGRRISSIFYEGIDQRDPFGEFRTWGENDNGEQTLSVDLKGELDVGDWILAVLTTRSDGQGLPVFTWHNDFVVLGELDNSLHSLGYSTANLIADETEENVSVTLTFNGVAALATVVMNVASDDDTPPVITLIGNANVDTIVNLPYTDAGAIATDNVDGDITSNIVVGGDTVDTSVLNAVYTITYDVTDSAGNAAIQATRTVTVVANPLEDAIAILKTLAEIETSSLTVEDINEDSKIGLAEVIYVLEKLAGIR